MIAAVIAAAAAVHTIRGAGIVPAPLPSGTLSSPAPRRESVSTLRRDLENVFNAPLLADAHWSAVVRSLATGETLFERNAAKLMVPASSLKVLTMAAAAEQLGWDARFVTTLEAAGPVQDGVLAGDLYVRGEGDPTINWRFRRDSSVFESWIDALRAAGITHIRGNIVGDDDLFEDHGLGTGWSWDDLQYDYAAPAGALQFNESVVRLTALPGAAPGTPAIVELEPGTGLTLRSRATTSAPGLPETIDFKRSPYEPVLEVEGTVPFGDGAPVAGVRTVSKLVAVINPTLHFVQAFRSALIARGITVGGEAIDIDTVPPAGRALEHARRVVARAESPTLREIGAVMMKESHNLYAETLLKAIGRRLTKGKGTTAAGRQAVAATLRGWKLDDSQLVMVDGSGLSRYNFVTAGLIVSALEHLYRSPLHREPFAATLAIAGRDGTIEKRLRGTRAEQNAQVKTGSMSSVRSLAGYLQTREGEPLVFCIMANNFALAGPTVTWIVDLLVEILANFSRR